MTVFEIVMCWLDFNALVFLGAIEASPGLRIPLQSEVSYRFSDGYRAFRE